MTEYLLENMTSKEAAEAVKKRKIVILPVGAIHKHGDGPLGTDMFSCTELARRLGEAIPNKVIVLPTLPYGVSGGAELPGGVDTSFEPVRQMIKDISMSFVKHGTKHFLYLTGHGGNDNAYLSVARELHKYGVLCAYVRWWDLIIQLKGDVNPNYRNVNLLEQSVDAALGKNDPSVLRDGETRTGAFQKRLRDDVFGEKFDTPDKMKGTLICAGPDPKITSIPNGVIYDNATIQIPLPRAQIDLDDPEPGDWPSIADKVSAEQGNDILNTCRDWLVEFLADFEKLEIPEKYLK
jgi:creatinine amidohydrolase/Fe(II)-dependent formamide hydrolase-like protein